MTFTNSSNLRFPKLRAIDIRPYRQNGQDYYLMRDPLSLKDGSLLVPQGLGPILALCDGSHEDAAAMRAILRQRHGVSVDVSTIHEVVDALNQALLLENEASQAALAQRREAYLAAPFRRSSLAGLSYADTADALTRQLMDYGEAARTLNGANPQNELGFTPGERVNGSGPGSDNRAGFSFPGIFSPHIDYPRGGTVYAGAWAAAADAAREADLVVMIGTDHYGDDLFTLTRQNYATPFGVLPTQTQIVDELAATLGPEAAFRGELRHINEHSLELVSVWLHHARRGRPVDVVPVLVGSLHAYYGGGSPQNDPQVATFLATLGEMLRGRSAFVLASGDLAHVGPAFGGRPLTPPDRDAVRRDDSAALAELVAGDAEGFFQRIGAIHNRNNVCGTTPGYLALKLMGDVRGTVTGYQSCPADDVDTSAVTVGGVVFE